MYLREAEETEGGVAHCPELGHWCHVYQQTALCPGPASASPSGSACRGNWPSQCPFKTIHLPFLLPTARLYSFKTNKRIA